MTDIGDWPDLIEAKGHYTVVPLNEYQMGNLLDALTQAQDTGDWWHELQDIIGVAMKMRGIEKLNSNRGTTFTYKQVSQRNILAALEHKI
jgi:hypothetical protein